MSEIEKVQDGYIDDVIINNQGSSPEPSRTSGKGLKELIKVLRDRFEQEITRLTGEFDTVDDRISNLETHFKGVFISFPALVAAFPAANTGDYANVDPGSGGEIVRYIWDDVTSSWVVGGGNITDFATIQETLLGMIDNKAVQPRGLEAKFDATKIYFADTDFQGTGSAADPVRSKSPINFNPDDFAGTGTVNDPIRVKIGEFLKSLPGWAEEGSKVLTSDLTWQTGQSTPLLAAPILQSTAVSETEIGSSFTAPVNADGPVTFELQLSTRSNFSEAQAIYSGASSGYTAAGLVPGTTYYLRLRASRAGFTTSPWATAAVTTKGSLPGYTLESTVKVNFSNQYLPGSDDGEWNLVKIPSDEFGQGGNYTRTNLRDSDTLENTGISVYIEGFEAVSNSLYPPTPSESAIFPDFVIISGILKVTTGTEGLIRIYGLDPAKFHNIFLMGNTSTLGTAEMKYTLGNESVTRIVGANQYQLADMIEFKDVSGKTSVDILVSKLGGAYYAGVCCLVIEVSNNFTQTLNMPGLTSTATGETAIANVFTPPANVSEGIIYELQMANNQDYSDAVPIYTGINLNYTKEGLIPGTRYFFRLRATRPGYTASQWDNKTVVTLGNPPVYIPNTTILVNFSNEYLPQPDTGEWNMAKIPMSQIINGGVYQKSGLRSSPEFATTSVSIYVQNFDNAGNSYYAPNPAGSAIYPDFVLISGITKSDPNSDGLIRLTGLNPDLFYSVYLMGNTGDTGTAVMKFTSGTQSVTKTIGGGNFRASDLAELKNISNGRTTADVLVRKISGVYNTCICSIAIEVSSFPKP